MSISLEVWGDYACFTRPELKTERVSYDIMTPSAARGLLESVYWHPGMRWVIDRIHVCAPIRFTNLRRNEVKIIAPKISKSPDTAYRALMDGSAQLKPLCIVGDVRQQRATMLLRDVRYVIDAHFDITDQAADSVRHKTDSASGAFSARHSPFPRAGSSSAIRILVIWAPPKTICGDLGNCAGPSRPAGLKRAGISQIQVRSRFWRQWYRRGPPRCI